MSFSASRLTCYALLSAIEVDMREALVEALPSVDISEVFPAEVLQGAKRRYSKQVDAERDYSLSEILPYVDFGDSLALLNRHAASLAQSYRSQLEAWNTSLERLAPIRNRVAHSRPLELNDLPFVQDLASSLTREAANWPSLSDALRKLSSDPSYVLNLDIMFPSVDPEVKRHNLPLPDFEDTGLLGRAASEKKLLKMLRGPYPVVSLVGDGGVGKTALALKAAYTLLDDPNKPFDAVVWTSAKAAQLTNTEVTRIEGAIRDSLGMLSAAVHELGGDTSTEDPMEEVLEYLETFKILLILDNLETVLDARLREFLSGLPMGSKVLITSRIGLGSLELPLKLAQLESSDAVSLLRTTASSRGLDGFARSDQQLLQKFCDRMRNHPLYIKWFVSVVQAGARPEDALADSKNILDFCMSNVYSYLGDSSVGALRCLQALPGRHSQAELAELSSLPVDDLQTALAQLITTNFVNLQPTNRRGAISSEYEVTEFAQVYLDRRHPLGHELRRRLTEKHAHLVQQAARLASASVADPYAERSLSVAGPGEVSIASRLLNAFGLSVRGEYGQALETVRQAQLLAPEYYETYRVEAMLHDAGGDINRAIEAYERALEHADGAPNCLYHAGRFFMTRAADPQRGLLLLQQAARSRREDVTLQVEVIRGHLQCGDASSALDGARGLLESNRDIGAAVVVELAARSAMAVAQQNLDSGDLAGALERIEELVQGFIPRAKMSETARQARILQASALVERVRLLATGGYVERSALRLAQSLQSSSDGANDLRYGQVARIFPEKGIGFLSIAGAADLFFGRRTLSTRGVFDRLSPGDEVCFTEAVGKDDRRYALTILKLED